METIGAYASKIYLMNLMMDLNLETQIRLSPPALLGILDLPHLLLHLDQQNGTIEGITLFPLLLGVLLLLRRPME